MTKTDPALVQLGKTGLQIPPMGIGAWSWGDTMFWGYGKGYGEAVPRFAFDPPQVCPIAPFRAERGHVLLQGLPAGEFSNLECLALHDAGDAPGFRCHIPTGAVR